MKALRNTQVPVYFLNAEFDYRNLLDFAALDPDCLHTVIVRMDWFCDHDEHYFDDDDHLER